MVPVYLHFHFLSFRNEQFLFYLIKFQKHKRNDSDNLICQKVFRLSEEVKVLNLIWKENKCMLMLLSSEERMNL